MRRALELHWPSFLVLAACGGLALSNRVTAGAVVCGAVALAGLTAVAATDGSARLVGLAIALAATGLWWGSLRVEALERSSLAVEIGSSGRAELVVTGAARTSQWNIRVLGEVRRFRGESLRERVLLTLPVGRSPPRGTILETHARVVEPRPPKDGFDERGWLARQGVHVVLRGGSWRELGRRGGVVGLGDRLRDRVEAAVARGTDGVRRGIVLGVVLGEDEGLPRDVQHDFRASGLYHLLAVSGQNVAFIALGVFGVGWLLRLSRVARELLVLAAIGAYVLAVGWQPSVVRAGVAGALASLAWLAARPRDRWHFLCLGALILLAWSPTTLYEPGFQLSFAAVAAIFVGVPRAQLLAEGYPVPRWAADVLCVAFVCGAATAPIVLLHFDRAPVYTVPANALAAPAMPFVLGLGLLAGAVDLISPSAGAALAWLAGWGAAWLELVARVVAALPGAQIGRSAAVVATVIIAVGWTVVRAARSRPGVHRPALALGAVAAAAISVAGWQSLRPPPSWVRPEGLRVTFLDVGQGDAALLETGSARVLVDQGPPEADVAGQLLAMGIRSLSALVLTHPERDHVGGAADVIRRLRVGVALDPRLAATGPEHEEALVVARARGVPVRELRAGQELRAGGLVLRALWPRDAGLPSESPNDNAVVLVASFGETDVLLPADAESNVTARLAIGDVEVLKVAHHGSEDPGLEAQLRTLRPEVAVVSAGRGNGYGHPRPETLATLTAVPGLVVRRTDLDGAVVVESDGRRLRVRSGG
ncbi:MAG: ComEC/Rec2 family competence protein [Gaiellaceae bacterium]